MDFRPSVPLTRAATVALLGCALVVVLHRTELLILIAPFLAWCALAWVRRPSSLATPDQQARLEVSTRRLRVQQTMRLEVQAPAVPLITAIHLPRPAQIELSPTWGATVGVGAAGIGIRPHRWGRQYLSLDQIGLIDTWGLWDAVQEMPTVQITVVPQARPLQGGQAMPHPSGIVGQHQSRSRGEGATLAEIRPFVSGDRLRRVNWPVSSRLGSLHVSATFAERDTDVVIITDTLADLARLSSGRDDVTGRAASSLDLTVSAAQAIAQHYLGLGDRVGILDLGYVIGDIRPGQGVRQQAVITERLAGAAPERRQRWAFRRVGWIRPGSLVLFCSPLAEADVLSELLRLQHRGATVLVIDTLPEDLGQLTAPAVGPRWWDEAWALRRLERRAEVERMVQLGIPVVPWRDGGGLALVIRALASRRAVVPRGSR